MALGEHMRSWWHWRDDNVNTTRESNIKCVYLMSLPVKPVFNRPFPTITNYDIIGGGKIRNRAL